MRNLRRRAAFSIIELLISLIIISILVAMVILIASQRAAEARLRTAQADMRLIAEAEQQAVTDSGYFLRLYVLDDITGLPPAGDLPPTPGDGTGDEFDTLGEEELNTRNPDGGLYAIVPDLGSLRQSSSTDVGDLVDRTSLMANETALGLGLPYITYQREYSDLSTGDVFNVPRDPWGQPYMIMTRLGFVNDVDSLFQGSPATGATSSALIDPVTVIDAGSGAPVGTYDATIFDRFTLVSFGPDALPGDGGTGDIGDEDSDDLTLQLN
ncbi:prepilin-type N-terminal cleavage/methylation domain-containing protein [Candidatus Sumerlaeota bacterium]|nr:prepilin-type N-terminal cleavage/methylation domain-containing protein [Candidatus Sumerlaeota bacterium]